MSRTLSVVAICMMFLVVPLLGQTDPVQPPVVPPPIVAPITSPVVAKIVGPKEAPAGELVVLSSSGSKGDNLVWIKPEAIQTVQSGCTILDTQVFFSTTKPGKYEFMLIAADTTAAVDWARHVVTVTGSVVNPPPADDPPPVDPAPPNPAKWANLITISKAAADKVNDPITRPKLKAAIAAAILAIDAKIEAGDPPGLDAAKLLVVKAIEDTTLAREGAVRFSAWDSWRLANHQEQKKLGFTDLKDYLAATKAVAAGL